MTPKSRRCYKLLVRLSSIMGYLKCNLFNFSAQYRYAFNASDAMSQRFYEIFSCSERKKILNQKQVSLSLFYNLGKRNSLYVVFLIHTRVVWLCVQKCSFIFLFILLLIWWFWGMTVVFAVCVLMFKRDIVNGYEPKSFYANGISANLFSKITYSFWFFIVFLSLKSRS